MVDKSFYKNLLGEIPFTAELYWQLTQDGQPTDPHFNLDRLDKQLSNWASEAATAARTVPSGKRVMIFSTLRYWIEHACLLGLALAGNGHQVNLAYMAYDNWKKPINRFDLRRQDAYAAKVLQKSEPALHATSFLSVRQKNVPLPPELEAEIRTIAYKDAQYTLMIESVDKKDALYQLRLERNLEAARAAWTWLPKYKPDIVIIPNGTILEFGAVFATARHLGIDVVTYEFGEQRERIWLSQNSAVMYQNTDALWDIRKDRPLDQSERERIETLGFARKGASTWDNFARQWQGAPSKGGQEVRRTLGLDTRPIILLATNVIGDSLTLGRQVFSQSMTEWLQRTADYFKHRTDLQWVVRMHPGEKRKKGPSVMQVLQEALGEVPEHIHLIPADSQLNTYDLIEFADLGLVYTTTVGLEMAMAGVPVIVSGQTHYRKKGFTLDPNSWESYFELLTQILDKPIPLHLPKEQRERAWRYAYSFFFEYPHSFPWHLLHYWKEMDRWSLGRVLGPDGQAAFGDTFGYLVGEPIDWKKKIGAWEATCPPQA